MAEVPPVRRRLAGAALRRFREQAGYSLDEAARILACDRSKISRIETGQRGIRPAELRERRPQHTIAEIAEAIGVHRTTVYDYLSREG